MISKNEFFNQFNSGQMQYTYFIMAIDASGIALALNKIDEKVFTWSMILFALGIVCWAISFFSGIRFQQLRNEYHLLEFKNMDIRESDYPGINGDKILIDAENAKITVKANRIQKSLHVMYNLLNYFMIGGMIFFCLYEICEITRRSLNL